MAHQFAEHDKYTQKIQDLNPECKEGSIPIMLLGVLLGHAPSQFIDDNTERRMTS